MIIIGMIIIVLFAVLIAWSWNNLYNFNKAEKVLYIFISLIIMFLITCIIFYISKSTIQYPNKDMMKEVRNVLLLVFTPINGIIIIPFLLKTINEIREDGIDNQQLKKRIITILIVFIVIIFIDCMYLKNIQSGILKIVENMKK